jgi:hypothetical protein
MGGWRGNLEEGGLDRVVNEIDEFEERNGWRWIK